MVAETRLHPADLILPAFVREGIERAGADPAMPGVVQHTRDSLRKAARRGRRGRGLRDHAVRRARGVEEGRARDRRAPTRTGSCRSPSGTCAPRSATTWSSCPTCAWTSTPTTGTAGCWTTEGRVDNDATLERYAEMAQVQADAGVHVVGPSGMMDGQVGVVRDALDQIGQRGRGDPRLHRRSTPPPSTGRSARPSAPRSRATARRTSRTRPTSVSRCASWRSTWRRAPTW